MALLSWNESLSVGVREIDEQHKQLIKMLNDMHEAMVRGEGSSVLKPVLNGLIQYTRSHFATEERYMKQFTYPGLAAHKEEHDALTWKVQDLQQKFEAGHTLITVETFTFLKTWLVTHIQGTDKKYSPFFAEHGLK